MFFGVFWCLLLRGLIRFVRLCLTCLGLRVQICALLGGCVLVVCLCCGRYVRFNSVVLDLVLFIVILIGIVSVLVGLCCLLLDVC